MLLCFPVTQSPLDPENTEFCISWNLRDKRLELVPKCYMRNISIVSTGRDLDPVANCQKEKENTEIVFSERSGLWSHCLEAWCRGKTKTGGILILISQPELGPQERSPERPCLDLQKEDGGQKDQAPGARS